MSQDIFREIFDEILADGYTRVPHIALEALSAAKINGVQKSMCIFLLRSSYGWGKIAAAVSLSDFARGCNTDRACITKNLKDLLEKRIIIKLGQHPQSRANILMFNHNIDQWDKECIDSDCFICDEKLAEKIDDPLMWL